MTTEIERMTAKVFEQDLIIKRMEIHNTQRQHKIDKLTAKCDALTQALVKPTTVPFGYFDPEALAFSRDKDSHPRGATVWPLYRWQLTEVPDEQGL